MLFGSLNIYAYICMHGDEYALAQDLELLVLFGLRALCFLLQLDLELLPLFVIPHALFFTQLIHGTLHVRFHVTLHLLKLLLHVTKTRASVSIRVYHIYRVCAI
jgi:hypothetical protein